MASIIREVTIHARAEDVWSAVRDFGALHERLVPGFVVDCHLEGDDTRVVTFFNGAVAREVLIGVDDEARRLAYSVVESPLGFRHNSASTQVFAGGEGAARLVWITDLLPDDLSTRTADFMEYGISVMKQTLESQPAHR